MAVLLQLTWLRQYWCEPAKLLAAEPLWVKSESQNPYPERHYNTLSYITSLYIHLPVCVCCKLACFLNKNCPVLALFISCNQPHFLRQLKLQPTSLFNIKIVTQYTLCNWASVIVSPSYRFFKCGLLSLTSSFGTLSVAFPRTSATCE